MDQFRVATWNSNGRASKNSEKKRFIDNLSATLIFIPHCGYVDEVKFAQAFGVKPSQVILERRDNRKKPMTVGTVVKVGFIEKIARLKNLPLGVLVFRWIRPNGTVINCVAVYSEWWKASKDIALLELDDVDLRVPNTGQTRRMWKFIEEAATWLERGPQLIAGDFNITPFYGKESQYSWRKSENEIIDAAAIINGLKNIGFESCYHMVNPEEVYGYEQQKTYWKKNKPPGKPTDTHIDYLFVNKRLEPTRCCVVDRPSLMNGEINERQDHSAVVVDLQIKLSV